MKNATTMLFALMVATLAACADEQPPSTPDPVAEATKAVTAAKEAKEKADKDVTAVIEKLGVAQKAAAELKISYDAATIAVPKLREELKDKTELAELAEARAKAMIKDETAQQMAKDARAAATNGQIFLMAKENEVIETGKKLVQVTADAADAQRELFLAQGAQQKAGEGLVAARLAKAEAEGKVLSDELKKLKDNPPKAGLSDKEVEALLAKKLEGKKLFTDQELAAAQAKVVETELKKLFGDNKPVILTDKDVERITRATVAVDIKDTATPLGALAKEVSELKALAAELGNIKEEINKLKPGKEPTVRGNPNPTPPQPTPTPTPQPVPTPVPQPVPVKVEAPRYLLIGGNAPPVHRHESGRQYRPLMVGEPLPPGAPCLPGYNIYVPR